MTNYFKRSEVMCPCCKDGDILPDFRAKLNKAREIAGIPFIISSGFRCPEHNSAVGGSKTSSHMVGCAVDIKCNNSRDRKIIVDSLLKAGLNRIGISRSFIHVDDDFTKDKDVLWLY